MFEFIVFSSSEKYKKGDLNTEAVNKLDLFKNEKFALQLLIKNEGEFFVHKDIDISWKGLIESIRIDANVDFGYETKKCDIGIMEFIKGSEDNIVADLIGFKTGILSEKEQIVYIESKIPKDCKSDKAKLNIDIFYKKDYLEELLLETKEIKISIYDYILSDVIDSNFHGDLWQHPCNWARAHEVDYFSNEHFEIIDNYLKEMSEMSQKVCDLIISDFSWAGQRCYRVLENSNNLFEMNIIKVFKDKNGQIYCDFSSMDRYLEIAKKYNIDKEINIFGVLANWDAKDFGNPLVDFKDPIRVIYKDFDGKYKYLTKREELLSYLRLVFDHLKELELMDKVYIISDEPANETLFRETVKLLEEANNYERIKIKCAIHDQEFFLRYEENIDILSLNTCELVKNIDNINNIKEKIDKKKGKFTWYSCCFPTDLNVFLKSDLIETRLIGWFTSYFNLDGFLRWAFGLWNKNVFEDASYKTEKWSSGGMFFVYPSKNGKPMPSLRFKNLIFGIQDFIFIEDMKKEFGVFAVDTMLSTLLGDKNDMKADLEIREVELAYSKDINEYNNLKVKLWNMLKKK